MTWQQLEKIFNRAMKLTFSKRKFLLVFPVLALCGLLAVICRTISHGVSQWMVMSMAFLPVFLCAGLLLAVGIVLTRIYHHEVKGLELQYFKTIKGAKDLFMGIPYLAVPLIFAYLILWMFLGIFYLLRAIPHMGEFIGSVLSFGPFLLVLGSLALGFLSLLTLFYVTPAAALKSELRPQLAEEVFRSLKTNPFLSFVMPIIGLFPLLLIVGVLSLAAVVTQILYIESGGGLSIALKWFFMMLPFCGFLTPAVIFFFNFSAESYVLMQKIFQSEQ
ncbi:MAG: hypothetical protein K940chlam6_00955 [Chlamydiae bacterium]|nr:hypothetical protein [Chlamydiota bacterium]